MPSWKKARFQTKLIAAFLLLSCIPAMLIGTIAFRKSSDTLQSKTEQDLDVILTQLNASIERQINDFDRFSMLPYFLPEIFSFLNKPYVSKEKWGSAEISAQKTMVRLMSAYPSINSSIKGMMVYGMNGTVNGYRMSGDSNLNLDIDVTHEAWYMDAIAQEGAFVTTGIQEIRQFKGDSYKAIIGTRLIRDEDYKPLAVMAIFISPDFIPRIVGSLELRDVQVTVLDREGNVIYSSDSRLAEQVRLLKMEEARGRWETEVVIRDQSVTYMGNYIQNNYLGWKVIMGVNRDEMLQGSRTIRSFTIVVIVLLGFAAGIVSWLLARGLSKPVHRLIRSMREVEKGKFSVPDLHEREDEIGQLESSYSRMVHRLDDLVQSIEVKERQKRNAELYALRARIQPHFLYNTLNSIRMLAILQQNTQISKLLQSLSKLLHANMKFDSELIALSDEISLLRDYARLMDLRYTNVFHIEWSIPASVQQAAVPPMLLQPLLENAIFHGAKGLDRILTITVGAYRKQDGETLVLEIGNDGADFPEEAMALLDGDKVENDQDSKNIGLRNVRDRIQLRFGTAYGLKVEQLEGQTRMRVFLPYITITKEAGHDA